MKKEINCFQFLFKLAVNAVRLNADCKATGNGMEEEIIIVVRACCQCNQIELN